MYRYNSGYDANSNGFEKQGFISIGSSKGLPTAGSGDPTGANYIYAESSATTDTELLADRGGISVYIKKGFGSWMQRRDSAGTVINRIDEDSSWARPYTNPVILEPGNAGDIYYETLTPFFTFSDSTYSSVPMAAYVIPFDMDYR